MNADKESDRDDTEHGSLDEKGRERGRAGSALAAERAEIELPGRIDREEVADGEINGSREQNGGNGSHRVNERRRTKHQVDCDPDDNHLAREDGHVHKVLGANHFA